MRNHFFSIALFLLLVESGFCAYAVPSTATEELTYTISYFEDQEGTYNLDDVRIMPFSLLNTNHPNLGLTESVYWLKIEIVNHTSDSLFWFSIQNSSLSHVDFYRYV